MSTITIMFTSFGFVAGLFLAKKYIHRKRRRVFEGLTTKEQGLLLAKQAQKSANIYLLFARFNLRVANLTNIEAWMRFWLRLAALSNEKAKTHITVANILHTSTMNLTLMTDDETRNLFKQLHG